MKNEKNKNIRMRYALKVFIFWYKLSSEKKISFYILLSINLSSLMCLHSFIFKILKTALTVFLL